MDAAVRTLPTVFSEDGPLGRWLCADWQPPSLAAHLSRIWYFDGVLTLARERVFPDGAVELIVHLGRRYRSVLDDRHAQGFPALCLAGLRLSAEVIEAPQGRTTVLGVRLTPLGAHALLRGAQTEACGCTLDLEEALGAAARELADAVDEESDPVARVLAAGRWVATRLREAPLPDPLIAWICRRITETQGRVAMRTLCEQAGVSPTRLPARFRAQVGVTPKHFARMARFRHALARLGSDEPPPLAELALEAGYADQPHFQAEFRGFAGLTPGEYLQARRYPNTVSLAEAA